jgi:hypothetical protein
MTKKIDDTVRVFFLEGYAAGVEAHRVALKTVIEGTMQEDDCAHVNGCSDDVAKALAKNTAAQIAEIKERL